MIEKEAGAGRVFRLRESMPHMNRECRRSSEHEPLGRQSFFPQDVLKFHQRAKLPLDGSVAFSATFLPLMAVVEMQADRVQIRQLFDQFIKTHGGRSRGDSGTVLTRIQIKPGIHRLPGRTHCLGESACGLGVIDENGKPAFGVSREEFRQPATVRPDHRIRQQDVAHAAVSEHFRFSDRGTLVFGDTRGHRHADNFARLVGFDMRPQARRVPGDFDGTSDVSPNQLHVEK